jgi:hypothetical protein
MDEEEEFMSMSTWNEPGHSTGGIWACLALLLPFAGVALAQDHASPPLLRIELNKIEAAGESCRTYFLLDSQMGENWRSMKLDLFALDTDGVAAKRLAVEVGPIPSRKTLIKLFDFPGLSCSSEPKIDAGTEPAWDRLRHGPCLARSRSGRAYPLAIQ